VALAIGVLIHLLFDLARRTVATPGRVRAWRDWQRTLFFAAVPMLGVAIGTPLGIALIGADFTLRLDSAAGLRAALGAVLLSAAITFALSLYFSARARRFAAERRAAEAQLRLLQGQIEPHFLFNTLASAQQLAQKGAPDAARLIGQLVRFLRISMPSLRHERAALSREFEQITAYLSIMQTRMGERLRFTVRAAPEVEDLLLPPALAMTLVENAVKHGIEPSADGGVVEVSAERDGERLIIRVVDTGVGLDRAVTTTATTTRPSTPASTALSAAVSVGTTWYTVSPASLSTPVYLVGEPAEVVTNLTPCSMTNSAIAGSRTKACAMLTPNGLSVSSRSFAISAAVTRPSAIPSAGARSTR